MKISGREYDVAIIGAGPGGYVADRSGFDYAAVHARSRQAAGTLADGVAGLLHRNKVDVIEAVATLSGPRSIALRKPGKPIHL